MKESTRIIETGGKNIQRKMLAQTTCEVYQYSTQWISKMC